MSDTPKAPDPTPYEGEGDGERGDRPVRGVPSALPEELRALGRSLDDSSGGTGTESMVERVLEQILAERLAVPAVEPPGFRDRLRSLRRWARARRRSLTAALCGLLTVLVLTPPVRAAVFDWFDFGGVEVRYDPSAPAPTPAAVPGCAHPVSLAEAQRRAGFRPLVPGALGAPDAVSLTREPDRRFLVTLCWREGGGTIRLDQDAASLDMGFVKTIREQPEWISLGSGDPNGAWEDWALWFPRPHLLSYDLVAPDGDRVTREERTAGPTLLWTQRGKAGDGGAGGGDDVTLRLEGVTSKERAVKIMKSVPEPG
ncbi:hypothetical protein ACIQAC_12815 [Streptomyces sp. NPDC088387]|uniref:hypothetical protein n=1 Tax=Streptomyces sp. NPDC088387 TaxID=3365859 RepID=UPI00381C51E2